MRIRKTFLAWTAASATLMVQLGLTLTAAEAQSAIALTGKVGSEAEPVMEGVVVSAKKAGSTITISVVTDEKGQYNFPAARVEPGHYIISTRAAGYDLDDPKAVDLTVGEVATSDLRLMPARNLSAQLTDRATAALLVRAAGVYPVWRSVGVGPLHSSKQPDWNNTEVSSCCISVRLEHLH
jgi:hypothetical protein